MFKYVSFKHYYLFTFSNISLRVDVYRRRRVLFLLPFLLFFFTNNFFWDVLGYEDGVLKSWLGACLKGLLIVHGMTKPKF